MRIFFRNLAILVMDDKLTLLVCSNPSCSIHRRLLCWMHRSRFTVSSSLNCPTIIMRNNMLIFTHYQTLYFNGNISI
ncbi:Uncharacterised protein [Serratia ficaria]|nr:Uncharacterised protein [Serratia ficaria]